MMDQQTAVEAGDVVLQPARVLGITHHRPDAGRPRVGLVRMSLFPQPQELLVRQVDLRALQRFAMLPIVRNEQRQVGLAGRAGGSGISRHGRRSFRRHARPGGERQADANRQHRCRETRRQAILTAAMAASSIHKQAAAKAPRSRPSSSGIQASGTSPERPIGTAIPATTAIARRDPGMRRPIHAASKAAATMSHCNVWASAWSCRPSTNSPGPPSRRKRIAWPPCVSSAMPRESVAR